jgi:hypothetical protein
MITGRKTDSSLLKRFANIFARSNISLANEEPFFPSTYIHIQKMDHREKLANKLKVFTIANSLLAPGTSFLSPLLYTLVFF